MKYKKSIIALLVVAIGLTLSGCQSYSRVAGTAQNGKSLEEIKIALQDNPVIEQLGLRVNNIFALDEELRTIASSEMGLNGRLQVLDVVPNSLAEKAGFKPGDHLVDIGGQHIPRDDQAYNTMVNTIMPKLDFSKPMQVIVLRDGMGTMLSIPASPKT